MQFLEENKTLIKGQQRRILVNFCAQLLGVNVSTVYRYIRNIEL